MVPSEKIVVSRKNPRSLRYEVMTPNDGIRRNRQIIPTTTGAVIVGIMIIVNKRRRPYASLSNHNAIAKPQMN